MNLFDGKTEAKKLDLLIIKNIQKIKDSGKSIGRLLIIQIGNNEISKKYVELKLKVCSKFGINTDNVFISDNRSDNDIYTQVQELVNDKGVSGSVIQLPLPRQSLKNILNLIPSDKDIDVLSSKNQFRYYSNDPVIFPPAVRALKYFLDINDIDIRNKNACVIGNGNLVGRPVAHFFKLNRVNLSVIDNYIQGEKLDYHIVILSAGVPNLVNSSDIVTDAVVVDFGTSMVDGKVNGDLNLKSDMSHLKIVSPSPGGMGPLVIRFLILNHTRIYDIGKYVAKNIPTKIYE